jgi:hypothetical protein
MRFEPFSILLKPACQLLLIWFNYHWAFTDKRRIVVQRWTRVFRLFFLSHFLTFLSLLFDCRTILRPMISPIITCCSYWSCFCSFLPHSLRRLLTGMSPFRRCVVVFTPWLAPHLYRISA